MALNVSAVAKSGFNPKSPRLRWSPKLRTIRVLSLRQPWTWLAVNGYKDIDRGEQIIAVTRDSSCVEFEFQRRPELDWLNRSSFLELKADPASLI